ncbi:MAG: hypothetical protein NC310_02785 [Roseburia sp.]|nr:hypothetical protein [Anaeroplasma bactoclasticum]MCM1195983.1 hypothetical protein [Roseburia sp.]MCM1556405.1 hypothetical protein [Anaeroplasma bactoclasticum]
MKIYEKPVLEEEQIQIEDICAASNVNADIPGASLPVPSGDAYHWGRK